MPLNTPVDLIRLALKTAGVVGVGQTPDEEDVNDCFMVLNAMLSQFNRKRYMIYHLVDTACAMTGAQNYSVGPGGNFNTPRTDMIDAAYARWLTPVSPSGGPIDYQVRVIKSREDYSRITLKSVQAPLSAIFYDPSLPNGTIYTYGIPTPGTQELHILTKETLTQFPNLTTAINLPPEYTNMLIWCLSTRIRPLFQLPPEPSITTLAIDAMNTIRGANNQIPTLQLDAELVGRRGSWSSLPYSSPEV